MASSVSCSEPLCARRDRKHVIATKACSVVTASLQNASTWSRQHWSRARRMSSVIAAMAMVQQRRERLTESESKSRRPASVVGLQVAGFTPHVCPVFTDRPSKSCIHNCQACTGFPDLPLIFAPNSSRSKHNEHLDIVGGSMRKVHLSTKLSTAVSDTHVDASFREPRAHIAKYLDGVVRLAGKCLRAVASLCSEAQSERVVSTASFCTIQGSRRTEAPKLARWVSTAAL